MDACIINQNETKKKKDTILEQLRYNFTDYSVGVVAQKKTRNVIIVKICCV